MASFKPVFKITPTPRQEEHINKIYAVLERFHGYVEISATGAGKTYITSYLADKMGLAMMVICPNQVRITWENIIEDGGAWIPLLFNQGEIRGSAGQQITKFPYLRREEYMDYDDNGNSKKKIRFVTTPEFDKLLDKGIFIVFDEVSLMKNEDSQITQAVSALVNRLVERPTTKSRYVLMSALMVDSPEQAVSFAQLMGFYRGDLVTYDRLNRTYKAGSLYDALDVFKWLQPERANTIINHYMTNLDKATVFKTIYELMKNVAVPSLFFGLPRPVVDADEAVCYYNMSGVEYDRYAIAVRALEELLMYDSKTDTVRSVQLKDHETLMRDVEYSKLGIIVREAYKVLNDQHTNKVIVNVDSVGSITMLMNAFDSLGITYGVIRGDVSNTNRKNIIEAFQEPNTHLRLIIATTKTAGMGISLHDKHGGFPRTTFIFQRFGIMQTYQAIGRTIREGSKSKATVRIVFGKHYADFDITVKERRIIEAVDKRSEHAKDFTSVKEINHRFPSDYPQVIMEPDVSISDFYMPELETDGIAALTPHDLEEIKAGRLIYNPTN